MSLRGIESTKGGISQFHKTFQIPVQLDAPITRRKCISPSTNKGTNSRRSSNGSGKPIPGAEPSVAVTDHRDISNTVTTIGQGGIIAETKEEMDMIY